MSFLKKLAGETALYGISSILGRLLNFLMVPLYVRTLGLEDNGNISYIYAVAAFFNVVYTYGMETAYFRFANKNRDQAENAYTTTFSSVFFSSIILSTVLILGRFVIADWMNIEGKEHYIILLAIIMAVDAILAIPFAKLRFQGRAFYFAMCKLANVGIMMALNLFFLVFCHQVLKGELWTSGQSLIGTIYQTGNGVQYVLIANLIANLAWIPMLWPILKQSKIKFDWVELKPMLIYAYPLLFMMLAGVTNEMFSRAMLENLLPANFYEGLTSKEALAVFGNCYKLSVFMNLGIQAFRYAAEPFFFSQSQEANSTQRFSQVMHWFIIVGSVVFMGISLNLDWIGALVLGAGSAYMQGIHIVPILLMANLFLGIYYNLSIWFKLSDKTHYGTWISIGGAILTIALNFWLIPISGYEGSSWVTLIVYLAMSLVCFYFGQKYYPIPYQLVKGLVYIILSIIPVIFFSQISFDNYWLMKALQLMYGLAFLLLVFRWEKIKFGSGRV